MMSISGEGGSRRYAWLMSLLFVVAMAPVLVAVNSAIAEEEGGNLLLIIPAILAAHPSVPSPPPVPTDSLNVRVYVAGESVEEFNHFNNTPLNADGSLNNLGSDNNTQDEYGWMVSFAQRLKIRDPDITVSWVGSRCWVDQVNWECSTGTYTNSTIGHTSAQAGSTVDDWVLEHRSELIGKEFCYDVAFASRGGNDLANGVDANTYYGKLFSLVQDLDQGSSCRSHPLIYVTAHLVDVSGWSYDTDETSINNWLNTQRAYYVNLTKNLVAELTATFPDMHIRFIDMWSPFVDNKVTTAFPEENWQACNGSQPDLCWPDMEKIHRPGDGQHPRRLASIFTGENVADQINIQELRTILRH